MPEIILENSGWWLLPIALLSLLFAWLLYFKGRAFSKAQRRFLFAVRFLIFFLLGLLLLSPLLKVTDRHEEKPLLVWLEDHSVSMLSQDDSTQVREVLTADGEELLQRLDERYEIRRFDFANDLMSAGDSFSATGTNLDRVFSEIREQFYNQNVGALVVLSDGIYNQGSDPSYVAEALPYPVYAVGFGDTSIPRDLFIDRVVHNNVSYLDNEFPVEVYLRARELSGANYTMTVTNANGQTVHRESFEIDSDDHFLRSDFFLKAGEVGLQRYTVSVSTDAEEANHTNNTSYFTIEVVSNRKKVAIIGSGPHPDMAALSSALENVEKYEISTFIENGLPAEVEADLYVLHNPSRALLRDFTTKDAAFWIIQGPETPSDALAVFTPVGSGGKGFENVNAIISGGFDLFKITEEEREWTRDLPPLWGPFGRANTRERVYPLFYKKIGAVETKDPLWFFISFQPEGQAEQKQAYLLGTDIWRWRINDYRENRTHEHFDGIISKTVQYLTTRQRRDRFDVDMAARFDQAEALLAEARLFNPSMELTNESEVDITFTHADGEAYNFTFSRAQNTYRLNAGRLPAGVYTWRATTSLGDENFEESGSVVIEESRIEETDLVARHDLLRKIANESGGEFFRQGNWENLRAQLLNNPEAKSYQVLETSTGSIIDKRWIFAIFLALMALEWGLRKYFGNY